MNILQVLFILAFGVISTSIFSQNNARKIASHEKYQFVQVLTYNTGLAETQIGKIDLVPCVKHREKPQVKEIFTDGKIIDLLSPFIIGLQEVFTLSSFNLYSAAARARGLNYFPKNFEDIEKNGQMIITNFEVLDHTFQKFSKDLINKGIQALSIVDSLGNNFLILNIHTTFSDSNRFRANHQLQFEEIAEFISENKDSFDGVIALGDFNAGPNLDFNKSKYKVSETVWDNNLLRLMQDQGLKVSSQQIKNTWDTKNKLVSLVTPFVLLGNLIMSPSHSLGWEEKGSILDHIFSSNIFNVIYSEVVMTHTVTFNTDVCPGRYESTKYNWGNFSESFWSGEMYLSDHFGVLSLLAYKIH